MLNASLITVLLLAVSGVASAASPINNINHSYKISGDPLVAPLQAFDDGKRLYLQLKSQNQPPVPFADDGRPIVYELNQPYMTIPILSRITMRLGQRVAVIEAAGVGARDSPVPLPNTGNNVYFKAATPARVSGIAPDPVHAEALINKVSVSPRDAADSAVETKTLPASFSGSFEVRFADQERPAEEKNLTPRMTQSIEISASGLSPLIQDSLVHLSRRSSVFVSADGTVKGWLRATKVVEFLRSRGASLTLSKTGAKPGVVLVTD